MAANLGWASPSAYGFPSAPSAGGVGAGRAEAARESGRRLGALYAGLGRGTWGGLPTEERDRDTLWGEKGGEISSFLPEVTPAMQYGESFGWGPRSPQGKQWLEMMTAQGKAPTQRQLDAYESQFTDPALVARAREAARRGEYEAGMERYAQRFMPLDVPTSLPSSINEFLIVQGVKPEAATPEGLSKATEGLRQHYFDVAQTYLEGTIASGGNTVSSQRTLDRIADLLDTGYYGEKLPLFDTLRRYSAESWEQKGYTSTERARDKFPYLYEGFRTEGEGEASKEYMWGGGGGATGEYSEKEKKKTPPATRSAYIPSTKSAYKQPSYAWDWRRLAPPTRWATY